MSKSINKFLIVVCVCILSIIISSLLVSSAGIVGVSPSEIEYKKVLRGGYAERPITISYSAEEDSYVELESRGDIAKWLVYDKNITISKSNPGRISISVEPPSDVPNGEYTGFLRISTKEAPGEARDGRATGAVLGVLDIPIKVEITDLEFIQCSASKFSISSAEKGDDMRLTFEFSNEGNIRLRPIVVGEIWDQERLTVSKNVEIKGLDVKPTKTEKIVFNISSDDLEVNQYWFDLQVPECYSSDTLTFDVLEEGALKAEGVIVNMYSIPLTYVDQTIPVIIDFKNTGEKEVNAYFKGEVNHEGKIIQLLESEKISIPVDQTNNFTMYFTPKEEGRYIVKGRVFYENKRTFESSTVINAYKKKIKILDVLVWMIYASILIVMILIYRTIKKERKRYGM